MKKDLIKALNGEKRNSLGYLRTVEKAYMDFSIDKYLVGDNVVFEQGSGRKALVHVSIVEEAIGCKVQLSKRAA